MCSACKGAHYCSMECQKERLLVLLLSSVLSLFDDGHDCFGDPGLCCLQKDKI